MTFCIYKGSLSGGMDECRFKPPALLNESLIDSATLWQVDGDGTIAQVSRGIYAEPMRRTCAGDYAGGRGELGMLEDNETYAGLCPKPRPLFARSKTGEKRAPGNFPGVALSRPPGRK